MTGQHAYEVWRQERFGAAPGECARHPEDAGGWEHLGSQSRRAFGEIARLGVRETNAALELAVVSRLSSGPETIAHAIVDWLARCKPQAAGSVAEALRAVADAMELERG